MPIYLHPATLVVSKKILEKKYNGGVEQFRKNFEKENDYFQEDDELFALARWNADEFPEEKLIAGGLEYDNENKRSDDYIILTRYWGNLWKVDWLMREALFAFHVDCSLSQQAQVMQIETMTLNEIDKLFDAGLNPFGTISSLKGSAK